MKTLIVVDGTGVYNGVQYAHLFRGSFCKQVHQKGKDAHVKVSYFQGPGAAGISTGTTIGGDAWRQTDVPFLQPVCKMGAKLDTRWQGE